MCLGHLWMQEPTNESHRWNRTKPRSLLKRRSLVRAAEEVFTDRSNKDEGWYWIPPSVVQKSAMPSQLEALTPLEESRETIWWTENKLRTDRDNLSNRSYLSGAVHPLCLCVIWPLASRRMNLQISSLSYCQYSAFHLRNSPGEEKLGL